MSGPVYKNARRRVVNDPHSSLADATTVSRFWALVQRGSDDECWEWIGYRNRDGYGVFLWRGRRHGAHELAVSFTRGEVRGDMDTCHSCDNPPCCNPSHLRFDSRGANIADMHRRGRGGGPRVLSDADVRAIRERRANGARQMDLARDFGVTDGWISEIVRGLKRPDAGGPIETNRKVVHV